MSKVTVFSKVGVKSKTTATMSKKMADKVSKSLVAQAIRVYEDRQHPGNKKAKTRAEVNITKKKIYRQKGTGNARHGAASAHIFVGGGVAHGPKSVKRELTLPQNMRKKALMGAMQLKLDAGRIVAVEDLGTLNKTKDVNNVLKLIQKEVKAKGKTLFVIPNESKTRRSIRNLQDSDVVNIANLSAYQVYTSSLVILDRSLL